MAASISGAGCRLPPPPGSPTMSMGLKYRERECSIVLQHERKKKEKTSPTWGRRGGAHPAARPLIDRIGTRWKDHCSASDRTRLPLLSAWEPEPPSGPTRASTETASQLNWVGETSPRARPLHATGAPRQKDGPLPGHVTNSSRSKKKKKGLNIRRLERKEGLVRAEALISRI